MSERWETIAGTKTAKLSRVDVLFMDELAGKHYAVESFGRSAVETTRYESFIDAWAAYLDASGWKDPGA